MAEQVKSSLEDILNLVDPDQYQAQLKALPKTIESQIVQAKVQLDVYRKDLDENPYISDEQRAAIAPEVAALEQNIKFLAWRKENAERKLAEFEEAKKRVQNS